MFAYGDTPIELPAILLFEVGGGDAPASGGELQVFGACRLERGAIDGGLLEGLDRMAVRRLQLRLQGNQSLTACLTRGPICAPAIAAKVVTRE